MPNRGTFWKEADIEELKQEYKGRESWESDSQWAAKYGKKIGRSAEAVRSQVRRLTLMGEMGKTIIPLSKYPSYNSPLEMVGDAVVLPDLEAPFQHAEFANRVLDLAEAWGIKQAILPGDAIHLDTFSGWQPNWTKEKTGGITEEAESKLVEFAKTLPAKKQGEFFDLLGGIDKLDVEDSASTELAEAGKVLRRLADQFDAIDWDMGNHCGRLLRTMETALSPNILLDLVAIPDNQRAKWRTAPYYFQILISGGEQFQVEHPKNASKFSASRLCAKYNSSVIMTHSHQLNYTLDVSGKYYAIEAGCMVEESRLAYCAQRHNTSPQHSLGAVIVKDGFPYLLHPRIDWGKMKNLY